MAGSPEKQAAGQVREPDGKDTLAGKVFSERVATAQTDRTQINDKTQPTASGGADANAMPNGVSRREIDGFRQQHPEMTPREIQALHQSINKNGKDPVTALTDAVKNNRVLGYGDIHIEPSPHNDLLVSTMPKLKQAGATHFAVEVHTYMKPMLDQLNKDGQLSEQNKNLIRVQYKHPEAFINILESARKSGLQVVPVDSDAGDKRDRNTAMADNIGNILKENPNNKVVFFVGAEHLINGASLGEKTAAQHLRDRNVPISTFYPGLTNGDMMPLSRAANRAVSFDTKANAAIGNLEISKEVKLSQMTIRGEKAKDWDNVILFPANTGTDAVAQELKTVGASPEKAILDALDANQVIGMGSLDWTVPVHRPNEDPQMKLLESMLPQLKAKGITHIAADLPAGAFGPLGQLDKTGKVNTSYMPYDFNQFDNPQYKSLLEKAHALGIKVVPVASERGNEKGSEHFRVVAQNVADIVKQSPQNKVLLITKSSNLEDHRRMIPSDNTVSDRLRANGTRLATFSSVVEDGSESLPLVTERITQPLAVQTRQAPKVASLHNTNDVRLRNIDQLIVYPNHSVAEETIVYPPKH